MERMELEEKRISLEASDRLLLLGYNDTNLNLIEKRFEASITVRGEWAIVRGRPEDIKRVETVIKELQYIVNRTGELSQEDVLTVIDLVGGVPERRNPAKGGGNEKLVYRGVKEDINTRTPTQLDYVRRVRENDVVFAIGPAGTGKTYLAVALALAALKRGDVSRVLVSRPAVEAGESLGFLPGDFQEKVDPYLRPIFDALADMLGAEKLRSLLEKRIVEVIPLAYMRGRTFNGAFIVLDEAQNTTVTQMKMFLTRLGRNSKTIITGDITQIDLPSRSMSGLVDVQDVLKDVQGIEFVYFNRGDVVRHRLVADIIKAYEDHDNELEAEEHAGERRARYTHASSADKAEDGQTEDGQVPAAR